MTTAEVAFKKAQKKTSFLVLGIAGPSGSGKTYSSLQMAKGLLGDEPMTDEKVAFVDTEHGSGSLYADRFNYAVLEIEKPYTPDKYQEAILKAQSQNFNNRFTYPCMVRNRWAIRYTRGNSRGFKVRQLLYCLEEGYS